MDDKKKKIKTATKYVVLTSHAHNKPDNNCPIHWGAATSKLRGPIIGSTTNIKHKNVIGTHAGTYSLYRALAIAAGSLERSHRPDYTDTNPSTNIPCKKTWQQPHKIVSFDPWGHLVGQEFKEYYHKGYDIRPTIAVTQARIKIPEIKSSLQQGTLRVDGNFLAADGHSSVTKVAIEPAWYLPGLAKRFNCAEDQLRHSLFTDTGGMYPELVTRADLSVFLPPIGGMTVYIFGDLATINQSNVPLSVRVHDECNGSDVFGSDICTCRPYLVHGIELCIKSAQEGGCGVIVYNRKEGRALGEVTKFLVYNARKRQQGGDSAANYFERTECIAGVQDVRFQELMPDVLHWLGITKIDTFASMSDMKYNAITNSGIKVSQRISIPEELIPQDAQVEMAAKKEAGYYSKTSKLTHKELKKIKGRPLTKKD